MQGRFSLFSRIVEELTYGCASSAWVYAVLAEHQWIIAQYPEQAQIDVWGDDPQAVASSSLAPRAAAKRVAGGWRLSGRYPFSSGCDYAQWAILGAFLGEMGDPRHIAYLLVPLAEIEIVDDWQVLGLAGTGSKSLVLHDVFIPEHRCVMVGDLFAGTPPGALVHPDYPVLRAPRGFLVSLLAAAGRDRARPPRARSRLRHAGGPGVARRDQVGRIPRSCRWPIGEAAAAIDVATMLLHTGREVQHRSGQLGPQDHRGGGAARPPRHGLRAASGELGVDRLCELDGARWVYDSDELGADPARRHDDPDPSRRQPPGRDGSLRSDAARQRGLRPRKCKIVSFDCDRHRGGMLPGMEEIYCFAGNPLDRVSQRRRDAGWVASLLEDPATRRAAVARASNRRFATLRRRRWIGRASAPGGR